ISEVAHNLWQGGFEEGLVLPEFFEHVVSLYRWGAYEADHELRSVTTVRMYDSVNQGTDDIPALAQWVNHLRKSGPVLVHCQAGLNRSALVVASALVQSG